MIRLIRIEWLKLRNYKIFWILLSLYLLAIVIICSGGVALLEWLKNEGAEFNGVDPTIIPIYDFPDIWQNMTWIASFLKIIPAFIVIISMTNETTYRTNRQNIIDGLSKNEFILSKFSLIFCLSLISTLVIFVNGLISGLIHSGVTDLNSIFTDIEFLGAFFIQNIIFLFFAFLLASMMRKAGFVIVLLFMYSLIFEPVIAVLFEHEPYLSQEVGLKHIAPFLPVNAVSNLIRVPFQRYVFMEIQNYIALKDLSIAIGWLIAFSGISYWWFKRKDL
ncbi:MAG: ABC transporter permease [Bacteroidota bacterium]